MKEDAELVKVLLLRALVRRQTQPGEDVESEIEALTTLLMLSEYALGRSGNVPPAAAA